MSIDIEQPALVIPANVTHELIPVKAFGDRLSHLPHGARVAITSSVKLGGPDETLKWAECTAAAGYTAVPHIAARSVESENHLDELLGRAARAGITELFVVGGDAKYEPKKLVYPDGFSLLEAIVGHNQCPEDIGIPGYPRGHTNRKVNRKLGADLRRKQDLASENPEINVHLVTQLDFSSAAILSWIDKVREDGITMPIDVGLYGAPGLKTSWNAMRVIGGGPLKRWKLMRQMEIKKAEFANGQHVDRTRRAAAELVAANADISSLTVNTMGAVDKTVLAFGSVYDNARALEDRRAA